MTSPHPPKTHSAFSISLRTAVILLLFTASFTALMAVTYLATRDTIAASAAEEKLKLIGAVLPSAEYDNALLGDFLELPPTPALGLDQPSRIYRARKGGEPVALVFEAAAADGYSGHIGLILAVRKTGEVVAVRVTEHRETPGLGDYIDPRKDKNREHPWITQFSRLSLDNFPLEKWRVRKDGGNIDQHSGATISARAVTNAVARAVQWAAKQGEQIFADSGSTAPAKP